MLDYKNALTNDPCRVPTLRRGVGMQIFQEMPGVVRRLLSIFLLGFRRGLRW
jgi:hypothetical protein